LWRSSPASGQRAASAAISGAFGRSGHEPGRIITKLGATCKGASPIHPTARASRVALLRRVRLSKVCCGEGGNVNPKKASTASLSPKCNRRSRLNSGPTAMKAAKTSDGR
jgi:hypothetical protein